MNKDELFAQFERTRLALEAWSKNIKEVNEDILPDLDRRIQLQIEELGQIRDRIRKLRDKDDND